MTSKLNNGFHEPDAARRAFDQTLADLDIGHLDLFLIHWPLPTLYDGDYVSTWKTLQEFSADGRTRSIGVSNFQPDHLATLEKEAGVVPAVNQIEVHPYFTNEAARQASLEPRDPGRGLVADRAGRRARRPGRGRDRRAAVGRTPAQVVLRWHVQRGDIVFPKSVERGADAGELRRSSTSSSARRRRARSAPSTVARRAAAAPTRTTFDYIPG